MAIPWLRISTAPFAPLSPVHSSPAFHLRTRLRLRECICSTGFFPMSSWRWRQGNGGKGIRPTRRRRRRVAIHPPSGWLPRFMVLILFLCPHSFAKPKIPRRRTLRNLKLTSEHTEPMSGYPARPLTRDAWIATGAEREALIVIVVHL